MGDKSCAVVTFHPNSPRHKIPSMVHPCLTGVAHTPATDGVWWVNKAIIQRTPRIVRHSCNTQRRTARDRHLTGWNQQRDLVIEIEGILRAGADGGGGWGLGAAG